MPAHGFDKLMLYELNKTSKRESCWLKQKIIKENIDKEVIKYTFRPKRPKEWKKKKQNKHLIGGFTKDNNIWLHEDTTTATNLTTRLQSCSSR